MSISDATGLTGQAAVLFAMDAGLRVVFFDTLILDPRDNEEAAEIVQIIFEGDGAGLTVEDPTVRGVELS